MKQSVAHTNEQLKDVQGADEVMQETMLSHRVLRLLNLLQDLNTGLSPDLHPIPLDRPDGTI